MVLLVSVSEATMPFFVGLLDGRFDAGFRNVSRRCDSTVAPTHVALLTAKKGPRDERRAPRQPEDSRQLTRRSRAGRAHRTRTPPDAHQAHRKPPRTRAATARHAPHRRPRPTGAAAKPSLAGHRPAPKRSRRRTGHRAPAPTNHADASSGASQRRIPPAAEDDDRDAGGWM